MNVLVLAWMSLGCGAARGTLRLVEAEQRLQEVRESGAPELAVYHWTMAEEHMRKAYEEWGYSDFGMCEDLSVSAMEWAEKAEQVAAGEPMDSTDFVPETVETTTDDSLDFMKDDDLTIPDEDEDEEEDW